MGMQKTAENIILSAEVVTILRENGQKQDAETCSAV
jgi:hypothetical protein